MSEDKNTALGSRDGSGYCSGVPASTANASSITTPMITVAVILTSLVILTGWDSFESPHHD
ncbi:MAG: hypothetical protein JWM88_2574 [Verrucomicrobia bacterium]|nr:hypothetical protein [Verrucomicrobiota bacterium]